MTVRKLLILLLLLSCSTTSKNNRNDVTEEIPRRIKIKNPNCLPEDSMIIQTINKENTFARLCPSKFKSYYNDSFAACSIDGRDVVLEIDIENNNFVDDQKVKLTSSKCFINNGIFEYTHKENPEFQQAFKRVFKARTGVEIDLGENKPRRLRIIKIIDSMISNPEYKN